MLDPGKVTNEILDQLAALFEDNYRIQEAFEGMKTIDSFTFEELQHKLSYAFNKDTYNVKYDPRYIFFFFKIALEAVRGDVGEVKSFIIDSIKADSVYNNKFGAQFGGTAIPLIASVLEKLSTLETDVYKELKTWLCEEIFGALPEQGPLLIVPITPGVAHKFDEKIVDTDYSFLDNLKVLPSASDTEKIFKKLPDTKLKKLKDFISQSKHYLQFVLPLGYKLGLLTRTGHPLDKTHPWITCLPRYICEQIQSHDLIARVTVNLEKNTFSFKRSLKFSTEEGALRRQLPVLQNAISSIVPNPNVVSSSIVTRPDFSTALELVIVDVYEEEHSIE